MKLAPASEMYKEALDWNERKAARLDVVIGKVEHAARHGSFGVELPHHLVRQDIIQDLELAGYFVKTVRDGIQISWLAPMR